MEEIDKLKTRALDEYLADDKYTQVEDLVTLCVVQITSCTTGIMEEVHETRKTGKELNLKFLASDLQNVIQHIAVFAYCLDMEIPEYEEIQEFLEDDIPLMNKMDSTLAALTIQHTISSMALEYFDSQDDEDNPMDFDLVNAGIIDIIGNCYAICNKYKLDFEQVIIYG